MNLKSIITLLIVVAFIMAFEYAVIEYLNESMANNLVSAFIPVATSVVGFFIGYQTNKSDSDKK